MQKLLTDFFNVSPSFLQAGTSNSKFNQNLNKPLTSSAGNTPKPKKIYKRKLSDGLQQTIIDAGQKRIGLEHCLKVCLFLAIMSLWRIISL